MLVANGSAPQRLALVLSLVPSPGLAILLPDPAIPHSPACLLSHAHPSRSSDLVERQEDEQQQQQPPGAAEHVEVEHVLLIHDFSLQDDLREDKRRGAGKAPPQDVFRVWPQSPGLLISSLDCVTPGSDPGPPAAATSVSWRTRTPVPEAAPQFQEETPESQLRRQSLPEASLLCSPL